MTNLLLLSPYDGASHRYWRQSLVNWLRTTHFAPAITEIVMPARHFSWRQRGNSLGFAYKEAIPERVDLILATSMTDLSALRGLRRNLATVPAIVYFHENQFAYPDTQPVGLVERQLTSIYTALSADQVVFNSRYNQQTFISGSKSLLRRLPDQVPKGLIAEIEEKSCVIPVALDLSELVTAREAAANQHSRVRIAWNHRWEHDKGPERLLAIVNELLARDADFEMSLFGERFRKCPDEFAQILALLESNGSIGHECFVSSRAEYLELLADHDVVLSTAHQEFQGLAVQEAMLLGLRAVVPDALSYPEYVPDHSRYRDVSEAADLLMRQSDQKIVELNGYQWPAVGQAWLDVLDRLFKQQ